MNTFDGMEIFARVVEAGSFSAAARQLRVSKSWASESVRALEERLGARLLDRTTRRLHPTEAGWAFFARCKSALDAAAAGRAEVQAFQAEPVGRLKLTASEIFARMHIVPALATFLDENPGIEIELVEGGGIEDLVEGGYDLAIRVARENQPSQIVRRIGTSQVVVVASPDYLAKAGRPERPEDVTRFRCLGYSPLFWGHEWRFTGARGAVNVPVKPILLSNNAESLRAAVISGIGLAALPNWGVADLLAGGSAVRVLEDWETAEAGIFAVYPSNRMMTPKVRRFVDHIAAALKGKGL